MALHKDASLWCLIESDPAVFSQLLREIGVRAVEVEELYDLDSPLLTRVDPLRPVYGLIFLFKWRDGDDHERTSDPADSPDVYFAQQIINNACATQAVLSIVLNRPEIDIGDDLAYFRQFTRDFTPKMKGLSIGNVEKLHRAHNSFARPSLDSFAIDLPSRQSTVGARVESETYHFVSYVPVNGTLYELDGLSAGPVKIGPCTLQNWLEVARPAIRERISSYSKKEIGFNLMAVVKEQRAALSEELARIEHAITVLTTFLKQLDEQGPEAANASAGPVLAQMSLHVPLPQQTAVVALERLGQTRAQLQQQIAAEDDLQKRQQLDNIRRKHNYFPFIVEMLKILGNKGELQALLRQAET